MTENKKLLDSTIKTYLKKKVREAFPEDYDLIESQLDELTERYTLKELLIFVQLEIHRIKNINNRN